MFAASDNEFSGDDSIGTNDNAPTKDKWWLPANIVEAMVAPVLHFIPKIKLPPTNFTSTLNGITWKAEMNPNYAGDEPSAVAITTDVTAVTITGTVAAGSTGGLKYKYT